jgi:hypothetical protein
MRHPGQSVPRPGRARHPRHRARGTEDLDARTWPESPRGEHRRTRPPAALRRDASVGGAARLVDGWRTGARTPCGPRARAAR